MLHLAGVNHLQREWNKLQLDAVDNVNDQRSRHKRAEKHASAQNLRVENYTRILDELEKLLTGTLPAINIARTTRGRTKGLFYT
jgi:hypothetical protein